MTKEEAINLVVGIAEAEVGYLEKATGASAYLYSKTANAGYNNYTKYGYEMHKLQSSNMDYPAAWCDAFYDWCHYKAFGEETARLLLHDFDDYTVNSVSYYKRNGEWHKSNPTKGDQIFFLNSSKSEVCHTGMVIKVSNGYVYTIEGNTSSASGVVANGGCVAKKCYRLNYSRIAGYGRPNYALVEKLSNGLTSTEAAKIRKSLTASQETLQTLSSQVAELEARLSTVDKIQDVPEYYREAISKLVNAGVLRGDNDGKLMLTSDMMRTFTVLDRAEVFDKL